MNIYETKIKSHQELYMILRILDKNDQLKPRLNVTHKVRRVEYISKMIRYNDYWYKHCTFIDEKPWKMGKQPNRQNTRHWLDKSQKRDIPEHLTEKHDITIHSFACINWNGKSNIRFYVKEVDLKKKDKRNVTGV